MPSRQAITLCLLCACLMACKDVRLEADAVVDRTAVPVLDASNVSTLISDSGIIRYRINTNRWQVYDRKDPSYWEFIDGVYLEKFNQTLEVEASICADYAKYLNMQGQWELRGNVHAMNEQGEEFDTPQLFWDQNTQQIYSDSSITIRRATSTLTGVGFRSNQTMTEYTILQPTGFFPIEDDETTGK